MTSTTDARPILSARVRRAARAALVAVTAMTITGCGPDELAPGGGEQDADELGYSTFALPPSVERWRELVEKHFQRENVPWALGIIKCESGGEPNAKNPSSSASGLFQQLARYWGDRSQRAGWGGYSVFHPEANIAVSAWLVRVGGPGHWECHTRYRAGGAFVDSSYQPRYYDNGHPIDAEPPPPPPPPTECGVVRTNQGLAPGKSIHSCDGRFALVHQADGNVVLYDQGRALWSTGTSGRRTASFLMQNDGNVVLYGARGQALWNSGTNGSFGARLAVQGDGNLVVYASDNRPLWATHTVVAAPPPPPPAPAPPPPPAPAPAPPPSSPGCGALPAGAALAPGEMVKSCDGRFSFIHQTDGNVVLYKQHTPLWSTRTDGSSTSTLAMQGDGNLVLYGSSGNALWDSATHGHGGARLAVQNDGNVVVYSSANHPLWATGTDGK